MSLKLFCIQRAGIVSAIIFLNPLQGKPADIIVGSGDNLDELLLIRVPGNPSPDLLHAWDLISKFLVLGH